MTKKHNYTRTKYQFGKLGANFISCLSWVWPVMLSLPWFAMCGGASILKRKRKGKQLTAYCCLHLVHLLQSSPAQPTGNKQEKVTHLQKKIHVQYFSTLLPVE